MFEVHCIYLYLCSLVENVSVIAFLLVAVILDPGLWIYRPVNHAFTWIWIILPVFSVISIYFAFRWQCAPLIYLIHSQNFLIQTQFWANPNCEIPLIEYYMKYIGLLLYLHLIRYIYIPGKYICTLQWFSIVAVQFSITKLIPKKTVKS